MKYSSMFLFISLYCEKDGVITLNLANNMLNTQTFFVIKKPLLHCSTEEWFDAFFFSLPFGAV